MIQSNALFIAGTGTDVGKTVVTCALARAMRKRGVRVLALKPYETGCNPKARDAISLAQASEDDPMRLWTNPYRARLPLSPYAATLEGELPPPSIEHVANRIQQLRISAELTLIESAGGLFVPLDGHTTTADLAAKLSIPVLIVTANQLGVLSHTIATVGYARTCNLNIEAVVLNDCSATAAEEQRSHMDVSSCTDPSHRSNLQVLRDHLKPLPVYRFPYIESSNTQEQTWQGELLYQAISCPTP